MLPLKRSLLIFAALCAASLTSVQAAQPSVDPEFAADVVDRYANHIYYGSGAVGMALVVIDGNQRVFRSFGETRPGNNEHPQLDSVIRIASISKLMTSEMLVKLLDQGVVKLNDPLSKYAPPGARVPTYQGAYHAGESGDPYQCPAARAARRRGAPAGICLANSPAALELVIHRNAENRSAPGPPTPIWHSIYSPMRSLPLRASLIHSCLKSRLPVRWG